MYWFAKLDWAVEEGDLEAAAEAQRQLRRLGVQVNYGRPVDQAVRRNPVLPAATSTTKGKGVGGAG